MKSVTRLSKLFSALALQLAALAFTSGAFAAQGEDLCAKVDIFTSVRDTVREVWGQTVGTMGESRVENYPSVGLELLIVSFQGTKNELGTLIYECNMQTGGVREVEPTYYPHAR